jgi:hypothetical protein
MSETTDIKAGFAVVDWDVTFEADDKGGPWKPGRPFRQGSLNYLRMPTVGTFARRWAMIERVAGEDALWVKGLFDEILRLVGGVNRPNRHGGVIRGVDGRPASVDEMAECLGQPLEKMARAMAILTDRRVGLLRTADSADAPAGPSDSGEIPGSPGESPETLGNPRPLPEGSGTETGAGSGAGQRQEQEQEQKQVQEQGQPPRNPAGSARSALFHFDSLLSALRTAYGNNRTIQNFASWLWQHYQRESVTKWKEIAALVNHLIAKSSGADGEPAAFFIGAVKKSPEDGGFGYQPRGASR